MHAHHRTVHLHGLGTQLWHATKSLVETVLAPLLLFYVLFQLTDFTGGLLAALGWTTAALATRAVLRYRIPAVLWLTAGMLLARTIAGFATGSTFIYFLEPSLKNFLIAAALLATVPLERTFLAKLADDFCVLPAELTGNAGVRRFFRRVSLLWAAVFTANGIGTLWALAAATLGDFMLVSTIGSFSLVVVAAVASLYWLRRELRGEGIRVRFGAHPVAAAA